MNLNWGKQYSTNNRINNVTRKVNPPTLRMSLVNEWEQESFKQFPFPYERHGKYWMHDEDGKQVLERYEPEYEMVINIESKCIYNK